MKKKSKKIQAIKDIIKTNNYVLVTDNGAYFSADLKNFEFVSNFIHSAELFTEAVYDATKKSNKIKVGGNSRKKSIKVERKDNGRDKSGRSKNSRNKQA